MARRRRAAGPSPKSFANKNIEFRENKNIGNLLQKDEKILAPLEDKVKAAAEIARGLAPVMTGAYRDSIQADQVLDGDKLVNRLIATDFKAHWVEFGTSRMPAQAVLRRAMEAAGLAIRDKSVRGGIRKVSSMKGLNRIGNTARGGSVRGARGRK